MTVAGVTDPPRLTSEPMNFVFLAYSVERFALHKPDPKVNVAVILGSAVPVFLLLFRGRRGSGDKPPV